MAKIKGALYVIAVEIDDPPDATEETREEIMRVLKGGLHRLSGSGGVHGKRVEIVHPGCKIMRFSLSKDD